MSACLHSQIRAIAGHLRYILWNLWYSDGAQADLCPCRMHILEYRFSLSGSFNEWSVEMTREWSFFYAVYPFFSGYFYPFSFWIPAIVLGSRVVQLYDNHDNLCMMLPENQFFNSRQVKAHIRLYICVIWSKPLRCMWVSIDSTLTTKKTLMAHIISSWCAG